MNTTDLIQALKDSNHLSKSETEKILVLFFGEMADSLAKGNRAEIRGLCSFFIKNTGITQRKRILYLNIL